MTAGSVEALDREKSPINFHNTPFDLDLRLSGGGGKTGTVLDVLPFIIDYESY